MAGSFNAQSSLQTQPLTPAAPTPDKWGRQPGDPQYGKDPATIGSPADNVGGAKGGTPVAFTPNSTGWLGSNTLDQWGRHPGDPSYNQPLPPGAQATAPNPLTGIMDLALPQVTGNQQLTPTAVVANGLAGKDINANPYPDTPAGGAGGPGQNLSSAPDPGTYNSGPGPGPLQGLDMTQPGALEKYQSDHAADFNAPTLSGMFAKGAMDQYGKPQQVTDNAQTAFNSMQSSVPANMDPYYDNQRRIANENINKSMAARGAYGSSAANDQISEADTNLAADQAQKEAAYGLNRSSLLGSLGSAADASSLNASGNQRSWEGVLGGLATGADSASLSKLIGGANVAGSAQGAQTTRGQNAFGNNLAIGDRMSGIMGAGYGNLFGADEGLAKDVIGLDTGTATEGLNQASNTGANNRQDITNFNSLLGNNLKAGQGIYDMFNQPGQPAPAPMPAAPGAPPTYNYPNQTTVPGPTSIGPGGTYEPPPNYYQY